MANAAVADGLEGCTLARLRKVTRRVTQMYDRALEPSGLTITQFGLLTHLNAYGGMSIGELANRLVMDATTLTRLLRPLEREDFVVVAANAEDRRRRDVELTSAGKAVMRKAIPMWRTAQDELRETLGPGDYQALQRSLSASLDHLLQG